MVDYIKIWLMINAGKERTKNVAINSFVFEINIGVYEKKVIIIYNIY